MPPLFHSEAISFVRRANFIKNATCRNKSLFLVEEDGFGPSKLKSNRFTVCPLWPLGNSSICAASFGSKLVSGSDREFFPK